MTWTGSRADRGTWPPPGWAATRRRVLRTHNGICHVCGRPGSDQVDHVQPLAEGGSHDDANLRPIHSRPCHLRKTAAESARGRTRKSRRPAEPHPGFLEGGA